MAARIGYGVTTEPLRRYYGGREGFLLCSSHVQLKKAQFAANQGAVVTQFERKLFSNRVTTCPLSKGDRLCARNHPTKTDVGRSRVPDFCPEDKLPRGGARLSGVSQAALCPHSDGGTQAQAVPNILPTLIRSGRYREWPLDQHSDFAEKAANAQVKTCGYKGFHRIFTAVALRCIGPTGITATLGRSESLP